MNKKNKLFIICHTIILTEENNESLKNKKNFVANGYLIESEFVDKKHKNNIEEIFTKYNISFDKDKEKYILCENNIYNINLKSKRSISKNKLNMLNTYKFKNGETVRFIHYVNFKKENDLIKSFYLKVN